MGLLHMKISPDFVFFFPQYEGCHNKFISVTCSVIESFSASLRCTLFITHINLSSSAKVTLLFEHFHFPTLSSRSLYISQSAFDLNK